jgi:hypothetical protein
MFVAARANMKTALWVGFWSCCALVGCGRATTKQANASDSNGGAAAEGAAGETGGGSSADVSGDGPCAEAARAALAENCDSGRVCNYQGYAAYCTSGDVGVTEAVYACVRGCLTVFDPGDDETVACLDSAVAGKRTTLTDMVESTVANLCEDDYSGRGFGLIAVMGGPTHAQKLASCLAGAVSCASAYDCLGKDGAELSLSAECS